MPQGSILGPLLYFMIYVNGMANVSSLLCCITFAEDTNLFGKILAELYNTKNIDIIKIVEWLNVHKLSLNLKMTYNMLFISCKRIIDFDLNIT